jgi:Fe-S-cluster-containing hydrogenase component 2
MQISVNKKKCKDCCICELACSFHHMGEFLPEYASIRIYSDRNGGLDVTILSTCDLCTKEKLPLCMEFCPSGAIKLIRDKT